MNILLLGSNGQVGWELKRSLALLGPVTALTRQGENGLSGDLSNLEALAATVQSLNPDVIVNAAAYTAVDRAESEPEQARMINTLAPARLAQEAKAADACLIHFSTDYVFDGSGTTPWQEADSPSPINAYGKTKFEGEEAIRQSGCTHIIFRTSWVYAARGRNFLWTMLKLAAERESLRVVDDQIGAPTGAELIADVTAHAIRAIEQKPSLCGTYHLSAAGQTSWYEYARMVIEAAAGAGMKLKVFARDIVPIPSEEFPTPAVRPGNSRLDTSKLRKAFGVHMPGWEDGVLRAVQEVLGSSTEQQESLGLSQSELRLQPNQENHEPPASLKTPSSPSKKSKGHIFHTKRDWGHARDFVRMQCTL